MDATVFKLGFLDSGINQKSNGTGIFSLAFKEREVSLIKLQTIFLHQTSGVPSLNSRGVRNSKLRN